MNKRHGFTLIELLVVIAIIAILAAILFPVMTSAKEKGKQSQCCYNLKQLAMGIIRYCDDNNGYTPIGCPSGGKRDWGGCLYNNDLNNVRLGGLWNWIKNAKVYGCPSDPRHVQLSYSMNQLLGAEIWKGNGGLRKLEPETVGRASTIMLLFQEKKNNDGYNTWVNKANADKIPSDIHNGGTTLSYCDGHVACKTKAQIETERDNGCWFTNSTYSEKSSY